ncbi:hypothetical protein [Paenibacillus sp. ALJ109b]|uniref:hypothetical protein n=1 Tax=Paenibacillus sp. ALJ109b TaxID=2709068 RepID=UPI0013D02D62|nr:hypothetical protein [Paenibacillus sp. ALJ109b]NEU61327.1 hypothetical protein [Paenibacillus sp. ALJ109b]
MAEMIVGLSKSNTEMRTTIRYLDQIQRSTERLGRVRYQSLIKVNNELRTTGRRLESIYSTAVRLSRLRITPKIGLDDRLSPALDRALAKLNSFRNQMVKASGTVSVEVKQKVEVAMGKMNPASSGPSLSLNIGNNNNTVKNVAKEEDAKGFWGKMQEVVQNVNDYLDAANNATDLIGKLKNKFGGSKGDKGSASQCCCCSGGSLVGRLSKGGAKGGKTKSAGGSAKTVATTEGGKKGPYKSGSKSYQERATATVKTPASDPTKKIITNMPHAEEKKLKMDFDQKLNPNRHGFSANLPGSPMSNMFSGNGMFGKLSGGLAKGAGKLLGPISMLADVANVATAPPEQRGRAVGSMIGGTAGTAIGSAIGSFILPGIGTYIGGALGGWAGSSAGGWIGDKAKDIGNFMSNATEGAGKALSTAADFVSEKTKNIASGISNFFGFGSKKEEKTVSATTAVANPTPVPTGPSMPPAYIPFVLTTTGPRAYANSNGGQSTTAALLGTSVMQSQAMALGNGSQTNANGKSSTMTVQISEDQMSSLSGYLKDFKTETTNQISVNVPQGAVQVTVRENAIDYDAISHQVGMRFAGEVRRAMENRKTIMA